MSPKKGRRRSGDRRMGAAINRFGAMGYAARDVCSTVAALLKVYGSSPAAWIDLEEGSYQLVQGKLLEMEEEEKRTHQQLEVAAVDESPPENDVQLSQENHMQVSVVQNVAPINKSQSAIEPHASSNNSPSLEPVLPLPPAAQAVLARPPCRGRKSEESQTENEPEDREVLSDIPSPRESLPFKRKRSTRSVVKPNLRG